MSTKAIQEKSDSRVFAYYNFNKIKISERILILGHGRGSGMSYIEKKST